METKRIYEVVEGIVKDMKPKKVTKRKKPNCEHFPYIYRIDGDGPKYKCVVCGKKIREAIKWVVEL